MRYQRHGRERMLGLGPLHVVNLKLARSRASAARLQLLDGEDPIDARRAKRQERRSETTKAKSESTFRRIAQRCMEAHESEWSDVHREQWRTSLSQYAYPAIGDLPVEAIDTDAVLQVLGPIWADRRETASRVRGRIERVLDFAKTLKLRDGENPARWRGHLEHMLAKKSKVKVHLAALPYREIPTLLAELRARQGNEARALEVIVLTACRSSEVTQATWGEIDLDN